jgi:hypothetical protein
MLPIKKIYIDTRWKTSNSKSDTDFSVQLPQNYYMPHNTVFYIDDVSIPVSWYSVQKNKNNKFYCKWNNLIRVHELPEGDYDAIKLAKSLSDFFTSRQTGALAVFADIETNKIKITPLLNIDFKILTDSELLASGYTEPLCSINSTLQNRTPTTYNSGDSYISGYLDFFPIRNLYLVSKNLGNHNTISINGESGIIKKIPVTAGYNSIIIDQVVLGSDYLDCSGQTLNNLSFRLVDVYGETINLNGNHWSFSIVFSKVQEMD